MLKIKDDVDLKELEKYGFKKDVYCTFEGEEELWCFNRTNYDLNLYVNTKNRQIFISSGEYSDCEDGQTIEPKLYDLIKADLVEKV